MVCYDLSLLVLISTNYAQGWRRSAKAKILVKALREYYAEIYAALLTGNEDLAFVSIKQHHSPDDDTVSIENSSSRTKVCSIDDGWSLKYISVLRMQPLLEVLDRDASSWVTVSEVNMFTTARPLNWRFVLRPHSPMK